MGGVTPSGGGSLDPYSAAYQAQLAAAKNQAVNTQGQTPSGSPSTGRPTSASNLSPVYIGWGSEPIPAVVGGRRPGDVFTGPLQNTVFGGTQWLLDQQANNPKMYSSVLALLRGSGLLGAKSDSQQSIQTAWNQALELASLNTTDNPNGGPAEVLSFLAQRQDTSLGGGTGAGAYTGPVTTKVDNETVNLTSAIDAKAILNQAFANIYGEAPTDTQRANFLNMLNSAQRENPNRTEGTSVSTGGSTPSQSQKNRLTNSGGVSAQAAADLATEVAQSDPRYAGTIANSVLMDTFKKTVLGQNELELV